MVAAVITLKQCSHPFATEPRCLYRYPTGLLVGPKAWVRTPIAILSLSVVWRWKGLSGLGMPRAGAFSMTSFSDKGLFLFSFPDYAIFLQDII